MPTLRKLPIEILLQREKSFFDAVLKWQERWTLSLAVGNGAGLAAIASVIVKDLSAPAVGLLLPSAWLFVFGLAVAGIIPAVDLVKIDTAQRENWDLIAHLEKDPGHTATEETEPRIGLVNWIPELVSAAFFVSALAYPMIVLTKRLILTGGFVG